MQAVFNISHSSEFASFLCGKGFFLWKSFLFFFCGKGEVDETSKLRSCVCLSLQVYGCNSAFMIICSTVDGIRG